MTEELPHKTFVVWGEKSTVAEVGYDAVRAYAFATAAELAAFLLALNEHDGWTEACAYETEEEANEHVAEYFDGPEDDVGEELGGEG